MKKILLVVLGIVLAILLVALGWYASRMAGDLNPKPPAQGSPTSTVDEMAVRSVVDGFGRAMKNVPLSGSAEVAVQAMDTHYTDFVSADLLRRWKSNPASALGRLTSSPWPERIDVTRIEKKSQSRYAVSGEVVLLTSNEVTQGGDAGRDKIELQVDNVGTRWVISAATVESGQPVPARKVYSQPGQFSIEYPASYGVTTGTGSGGANLDRSLVRLDTPEGAFGTIGTNYSESYLVISESTNTSTVANCVKFTDQRNGSGMIGEVKSNGITFKKYFTTEAAAGNIYESTLYRTSYQGRCYEVALVVHVGNAANYDPPVEEFDRALALQPLEEIFRTFRFEVR